VPPNPVVVTVSIVRPLKGGIIAGSATAFFYCRGEELFLVTNRHVVRDGDQGQVPDLLRLRLHTDSNNVTKNGDHDVPLCVSVVRGR